MCTYSYEQPVIMNAKQSMAVVKAFQKDTKMWPFKGIRGGEIREFERFRTWLRYNAHTSADAALWKERVGEKSYSEFMKDMTYKSIIIDRSVMAGTVLPSEKMDEDLHVDQKVQAMTETPNLMWYAMATMMKGKPGKMSQIAQITSQCNLLSIYHDGLAGTLYFIGFNAADVNKAYEMFKKIIDPLMDELNVLNVLKNGTPLKNLNRNPTAQALGKKLALNKK